MILGNRMNLTSIQNRISFSFILLFTSLALIVIIGIRGVYAELLFQRLVERIEYENKLISQQLGNLADSVNSCSNSIIINLNIVMHYGSDKELYPNIADLVSSRKIFSVLDSNMLMFDEVNQFAILYHNGDMYIKDRNNWESSSGHDDLKSYLDDLKVDTKGKWCYPTNNKISAYFSKGASAHFYAKTLRNTSTNAELGYIILAVDESQIYSRYFNKNTSEYISSYVYTDDKILLSSSSRDEIGSSLTVQPLLRKIEAQVQNSTTADRLVYDDREYYYQLLKLTNSGWNFLTVVKIDEALSDIKTITYIVIMVSTICLIVFYVIIVFMSKTITKPIRALSVHMADFKDTLPESLPERRTFDEIAVLIKSFNAMICKNNELFERVHTEQQIKRKLELALIQEQIKPHFLYNTLDTIFCLNSMKYYDKASEVTKLLADYYRLVLNNGEEWISVEKELDAVRKYLEIQKSRYSDVLSYSVNVPAEIMPIVIPKMLLQPLIENAIYHGIKPTCKKGYIVITGEMVDEWVYLRVVDNGMGMSDEQFNHILTDSVKKAGDSSFGLKSVSDRIKLFYGSQSKLELEHSEFNTTSIKISIFLGAKEEYDV